MNKISSHESDMTRISAIVSSALFSAKSNAADISVKSNDFRGHVTAMIGERPYVLYVRETPDVYMQLDKILEPGSYWLLANGKPLRCDVPWSEYGFTTHVVITVIRRMRGGSSRDWDTEKFIDMSDESAVDDWVYAPNKHTLSRVLEGKSQRLQKKVREKRKALTRDFILQAFEEEVDIAAFLDKHMDRDIVSLAEDLAILCVQLLRAKSTGDKCLAMMVFVKLRTGSSLLFGVANIISDVVNDVNAFYTQSDDASELDKALESVTDVRSLIHNWEGIQKSTLAQGVLKVYKYAIAVGALAAVGIKVDENTARMCKSELGGPLAGPNFVIALLDSVAMFVQRALLFAKTGHWSSFFHGSSSYSKWYDECMKIKRDFLHVGDLEAHGTSYHQFVKDLTSAIETGEAIAKFGDTSGFGVLNGVKRMLNDLKLIQADMFTFSEAQKSRRPPFALLVHGKTCVGKSLFTEVLFQWMGRVMNLPRTEEFKYSRNPSDDFWSGWNSSKWFIHLDDIAYLNPASQQKDMSLVEVIQLINDVVMVPNQARLEDKGKNPVRARAVVATTNTKHLNAHAHFACPIAVQRRLPFVVTVQPKPEFACDNDAEMIDSNKLPPIETDWPDFWLITVERVVAAGDNMAGYDRIKAFGNIQDFLVWLKETILNFNLVQARAGRGNRAMASFKVCDHCDLVESKCKCHNFVSEPVRFAPHQRLETANAKVYDSLGNEVANPLSGNVFSDKMFWHHTEGWSSSYKEGYVLRQILTEPSDSGSISSEQARNVVANADRVSLQEQVVLGGITEDELLNLPQLESEVQAGEFPATVRPGEPFKMREVEGTMTYIYEYTPMRGGGPMDYMLTTTTYEWDEVVSKRTCPAFFTDRKVKEDLEVQSNDVEMAEIIGEIVKIQAKNVGGLCARTVTWAFCKYLNLYAKSRTVRRISNYAMEWKVVRKIAIAGLRWHGASGKTFYEFCGNAARAVYVPKRWRLVLGGIAATTAVIGAYGLYASHQKKKAKKFAPQGLRASVDDAMFPKSEKENVWKRDDFQISSFDVNNLNVAWKSLPYDQVNAKILRNVCRIRVSNGERVREGNALCAGGHLWLTNAHTFFEEGDLEVTLLIEQVRKGVSPNVTFKLRQADIYHAGNDVAFFEVHCWEVKSDLRELFSKSSLRGSYTGALIGYTKPVIADVNRVKCIQFGSVHNEQLGRIDAWHGYASRVTVVGDCGMPLIVHEPVTAILGIHTLGNKNGETWCTSVTHSMVEDAVAFFDTPIVQCAYPVISAPSKPKQLTTLRIYSPLRWLESGSLRCYGSYTGYSVTSRSKVKPTLLGPKILEERKWDVDYIAPKLNDWRPWNLALTDITQQKHGSLSPSILKECAKAYVSDVLEALKKEDLDIIQPLSDKATINGIPGVKFIDKMNFKSSMGEPYNKTKKEFLVGEEGNMDFIPEVKERISKIMEAYSRGQRAAPVFSGKLKDEPRLRKKVAAGKVRVFTGAPADWSFVVRKYLLTIVKVIQENPFIFEASPGCTVQSVEWEQYYDYLTQFGVDRIIAGDYGKFDKRMEAILITLAFWILAQIMRAAGWSEDQLDIVYAIGEDTAYSFANFDGDLLMFFGSNPSGQPLTVIINCLVNALYMRYAFVQAHPDQGRSVFERAKEFKKLVALLTYGDDNGMGVHKSADWFNHTEIQRQMAAIGVEYTMADKESESKPFIHISEVSYLKRRWRWDEDIGAVVCPLEMESIHKMLTICNPSDTESKELHMASVMVSAANEWFWYGKETFEKERAWLVKLAHDNDLILELEHKRLPTWEELVERFNNASIGIVVNRHLPPNERLGCVKEHPRSVLPN
nr:MAG: nonstructural polyprotein [Marnaviridae sp.]